MSSSSNRGTLPPRPPTLFISTSSHSRKLVTERKRPLSLVDQLVKTRRNNDTSRDYELTQVQDFQNIEAAILILRMQRLKDYEQLVYIPPLAKTSLQGSDDTPFPLMDKVKAFLAGDCQVMLILGDSGAGKSTFNRHLEYELWQNYKTGDRIPLFINLPALERPEKDLVAEQLKNQGLSDDQIRELKVHRQFMLICDGYDESQLTSNIHTTNLLNRSGQWSAKLLITCRSQYLGLDYRLRFVPEAVGRYNRAADNLFMEAVMAPFSKEQIELYVEQYVPLEPRTWFKKDYMDKLTTIPNLMDLVKNPFLLTLCLEALPNVVEGKSDLLKLCVTRVQLYDTFVQHWLEVNKRRLQNHKQDRVNQLAFEGLLEDGFELNGIKFQQELAAAIFRKQDGRPVVDYTQRHDGSSWKALFFGSGADITILRGASLLSRVGTQHRFVHRSILEYFYSCTIYGPAESNGGFAPHSHFDPSSIGDHPLSQRNLVVEPSIIQFLAQRVELEPGFKQQLLAFMEQSKTDSRASCAATNAISILVKAGTSFNNADLRGIRVPGADLSGGQFDSAQLQQADFTGVNLTGSWIRQADFSKARMEGVKFGELPYLVEPKSVISIVYSVNGGSFAVGLKGGNINIYNTANWTRAQTLEGHSQRVSGLAYSPSGDQLFSGSHDCTVRLWSCKTGLTDIILRGHTDWVRAVAFSPAGNQVASASRDMTVRLWDPRTGAILFVLQGHTKLVNSISYSPDGRSLVSGSWDGKLRIFGTHSGQVDLVLQNTASVRCVAYSPDGLRIIAGDGDGYLLLWKSSTDEPVKRLKGPSGGIDAVVFSPNGQWIASSSANFAVTLWDAHSLMPVSVFIGHSDSIRNVMFSPNSLQLASGSQDRTVRLWDVTTARAELSLTANQSDKVWGVAYSPDGSRVISGGRSGTVRQYDGATGDSGSLYSCGFGVDVIVFSPDGRRIAAAGHSHNIRTWNADTGVDNYLLQGHSSFVYALVYSPDSQWIASGSSDKTVRLWYACSGVSGLVLSGHDDIVYAVAFSPCGLQLVSGSEDGTIRVWDVGTGESRVAVDTGSRIERVTIRYSPIGMQIALQRHESKHVELWDEESVEPLHSLQYDARVGTFSLSPCGHWIAIDCDGSMWLWKLIVRDASQEWDLALVIRDILKYSSCIGWRPDALEVVTGGGTDTIHAWKLVENQDGKWSARLTWSSGRTAFTATDATIVDAVGLSAVNHKLLKQRGAKSVTLST